MMLLLVDVDMLDLIGKFIGLETTKYGECVAAVQTAYIGHKSREREWNETNGKSSRSDVV